MNNVFEKSEINFEKIFLQENKKENILSKSMEIILEEESLQFSIDNVRLPTLYSTNFKSDNELFNKEIEKDLVLTFNNENMNKNNKENLINENIFESENENENNNNNNNNNIKIINTKRRSSIKIDLAFDIPSKINRKNDNNNNNYKNENENGFKKINNEDYSLNLANKNNEITFFSRNEIDDKELQIIINFFEKSIILYFII